MNNSADDIEFQLVGDSKTGLVVSIVAILMVVALMTWAMSHFFTEVAVWLSPNG